MSRDKYPRTRLVENQVPDKYKRYKRLGMDQTGSSVNSGQGVGVFCKCHGDYKPHLSFSPILIMVRKRPPPHICKAIKIKYQCWLFLTNEDKGCWDGGGEVACQIAAAS